MKQWTLIGLLVLALLPKSSAAESLRVVTLEYPPYIESKGSQVSGIAVNLVAEIFSNLEIPAEITVLPWARALNYMETGEADAIFTLFKTPQREEFVYFSEQVLFRQNISLIHNQNSSVNSNDIEQKRFSGLSLCVVNKVSYGEYIDSKIKSGAFKTIARQNSAAQCALMLSAGRVDLWVSNEFGARSIIARLALQDKLEIMLPPMQTTLSYIAFSKKRQSEELRNSFDVELQKMKQTGRYFELIDDYFSSLTPDKTGM
ncbi:amino acid ABC transporter [Vibrio cidicii]|uniref:substrate-binding periplasmic protein n=1 Tax=Vibrio cidicii TaxID=1763883 RepID=UPI0018C21B01|nr:transporter substrate-binding domain-containing protein [Vibrio cidicii]MBG0761157.1 amino acid ABC transporter [Vibrio cidicii]